MDIKEVAGRAAVSFPPRRSANPAANPAPDPSGAPGTERPRDAAASAAGAAASPAVQTQSARVNDSSASDPDEPSNLQAAVEKIQEFVSKAASDIKFSIDEDSGRTVVKVIDRETQDVIRQIPSKEMLDLAQALDKLQGLLIKQKA
jgi:flagellar protein FlaG